MVAAPFLYLKPKTISEAISLLGEHGDEAKILSGGQSLIPMMKFRLARPAALIDINGLPGLTQISEADGYLSIGALVREADIESSELIRLRYPLLHDVAGVIADPQVRNMATLAGNLAHGDPANDHPAAMLALGAQVVAAGPAGERLIPIEDFFISIFTTALQSDEILTEIRIPVPAAHSGGAYLKLERKVGDYATAAVAAQITLDREGQCVKAGIGLTNVGPTPLKARAAEQSLLGQKLTEEHVGRAAQLAADESQPSADLRGPVDYKRGLVKELTKRALVRAAEKAGK